MELEVHLDKQRNFPQEQTKQAGNNVCMRNGEEPQANHFSLDS
jgi:hypothetical protein